MAFNAMTRSPEFLLWEAGWYTQNQLAVEEMHTMIHEYWSGEQEGFRAAYTGLQDAERALVAARAHRDRQKFKMRGSARLFAEQLIQVGGGNPKSDVYTRYFEDGYGIYGRVTLERQLELAQSVLVCLDSEANETVKAAGEPFRAAVETARSALADYQAKEQVLADAKATMHAARIQWRGAYRKVAADLRSLHTDDPRYVSSFFLSPPRKKKGTGEVDVVVDAVDEGSNATA